MTSALSVTDGMMSTVSVVGKKAEGTANVLSREPR